jgi:hypothetical protein
LRHARHDKRPGPDSIEAVSYQQEETSQMKVKLSSALGTAAFMTALAMGSGGAAADDMADF